MTQLRTEPDKSDLSVKELLRTLMRDSSDLVHQEIDLLKAEIRETTTRFEKALVLFAIGGALGIAAALVLLSAINRGLTSLLAQWISVEVAVWLAPLLLALVFGGIAFLMFRKGGDVLKDTSFKPKQTVQTLQEDKEWMKRKAT
ncbi:MAG TPA: phage holin family protein [Thermoanaerobaculia bacterium]|nr:phage holin family protein [Thermoanaerobaculia bacterium]